MSYKAVLLDFGGVVFKNRTQYEGPVGLLDIDKELWTKGTIGEIDDDHIFRTVARQYNVNADSIKSWLVTRRELNEELIDLVSLLKPEIKTAIVNNGLKTLFHTLLDKYNVKDKFSLLVNSAEEGIKKPDPKLYLLACERLEVSPKDCLFVDDSESFIQGAEQLGMKGYFFTSVNDLKVEFEKLDLLVNG